MPAAETKKASGAIPEASILNLFDHRPGLASPLGPDFGAKAVGGSDVIKNGRPSFQNCITRQPIEYLEYHSSRKEGIFQKSAPLYEQGYSLRQIADETGFPRTSIRDALSAGGIDLKSGKAKTVGRSKTIRPIRLGVAPYGFAWLRGRLVADPREGAIIRLIVQSWQSGHNFTAITQQLNRLKRRTRSGGAWDHSLVRRIVLRYQQNPNSYKEALS